MSKSDYRAKRGLLPPMTQSPKSSPEGEPQVHQRESGANSVNKPKHRQLKPLEGTFNKERHLKRNRKLTEYSNRATIKNAWKLKDEINFDLQWIEINDGEIFHLFMLAKKRIKRQQKLKI